MAGYLKANGGWQALREVKAKAAGDWQTIQAGYAKVNGQWQQVYVRSIATTTTINLSSTDLYEPSALTISGTVTSTFGGVPTGNVIIEQSTNGGSTWTTVDTVSVSGSGDGSYTKTFTPSPTATTTFTYRARYLGDVPYVASTSSNRTATYHIYIPTFLAFSGGYTSLPTFTNQVVYVVAQQLAGQPLYGQTITVTANGTVVGTAVTNDSGVAAFNLPGYGQGTTSYVASFAGSGDFMAGSVTRNVDFYLRASTITLATPSDAYYAEPMSLVATVSGSYGGAVQFQYLDGSTWTDIGGLVQITASTLTVTTSFTRSTVVTGNVLEFRAVRQDDAYYEGATSTTVNGTFVARPTSVTVTVADSTVTEGTSVTFTATLKDSRAGTALASRSVAWANTWRGKNGAYTSQGSSTTNASGVTTKAYTGGQSYTMRASFAATGIYAASSDTQIIYMLETFTDDASASRSYDSAGNYRYANYDDRIYHGYYDSTNGDQRGAIWFENGGIPWSRVSGCYSVASAYLNIKRGSSAGNSTNTTFYAGTHTDASVSSTWGGISGKAVRLTSKQLDLNQDTGATGWELGATARANFKAGARGIVIGNANSTSMSYYGWLIGANVDGQPYLTINFYDLPA